MGSSPGVGLIGWGTDNSVYGNKKTAFPGQNKRTAAIGACENIACGVRAPFFGKSGIAVFRRGGGYEPRPRHKQRFIGATLSFG
jgi:hypothetical protein